VIFQVEGEQSSKVIGRPIPVRQQQSFTSCSIETTQDAERISLA